MEAGTPVSCPMALPLKSLPCWCHLPLVYDKISNSHGSFSVCLVLGTVHGLSAFGK